MFYVDHSTYAETAGIRPQRESALLFYCHIAICIHPVLDTSRFPDTDWAQREGLRVSDAEATTVCQIVTKSAHLPLNGESHMAWSVLPSPCAPLTGSAFSPSLTLAAD